MALPPSRDRRRMAPQTGVLAQHASASSRLEGSPKQAKEASGHRLPGGQKAATEKGVKVT